MQVDGLADDSGFEVKLQVDSSTNISETAHKNRTAMIKAYEAMITGDFDTWWSYFDKDVEFYEAASLPYGFSSKGLEEAKQGMAGMFEAWKHLEIKVEEFTAAGDLVIIYIHMKATSRKTGKIYEGPVAELFRFRNDKIIEWRPIYWDTHMVREACDV